MRAEFPAKVKLAAWRRAAGRCECTLCERHRGERCCMMFGFKRPTYDHVLPCEFGGDGSLQNCQVLCEGCDREKTYKRDIPAVAKSNRIQRREAGIRKDRTIRTWRKFDGTPVFKPRER